MIPRRETYSVDKFREFIYHQHDVVCNQKYSGILPYSFHLQMVEAQYNKFEFLLTNKSDKDDALMGCIAHDSIEDARLTFNEIIKKSNKSVGDIVILCTEFSRGKTRDERKPVTFYAELDSDKIAVFVKLCDIIANSLYSCISNSSMFTKYKDEYEKKVRPLLFTEEYEPMFEYLDRIYSLTLPKLNK